jgi:type III restriction enzyme
MIYHVYQVLEQDAKRTRQTVDVSPAEARDSGLIKKYITVWHTDEEQKSDYSLLARAGEEFDLFEKEWARHHKDNPESKEVAPALVIQVEDGNGKKGSKQELSKTDLEKDIDVLMEKVPDLEEDQIAHCFQDGADKSFGRHTIRYVAPSDIEAATDIRVIFFKMSLTTGWDCPRAEVIFSHRGAKDETYIAQLLGRMVRTPLAYEVSSPEKLSGVTLFLPSYNQDTVTSVVDRLREDDPEGGVPANDVQIGNTLQMLHRSKDKSHQEVFTQIETLPAFKVERVPELKPVRRLLQLGDRLAIDGIDAKAKERYEKALFSSIEAELKKLQKDPERYKSIIDELDVIDIAGQTFAPNDGEQDVQEEKAKVETHSINIDDSFKLAGRKLSAGYQDKYLKQRAEADPKESVASIKKDFIAVVLDDISLTQIEDKAQVLCDKELEKFNAEINKTLSKDEISKYRAIRQQAAKPFPDPWTLPEGPIEAKKGAEVWEKHLFVTNDKEYSGTFTELEKAVLEADIPAKDCVGWLRNEDRKSWAFSLVYDLNGEKKNMYPDFLFFRKEGKHIVVDIVEPHTTSKSDSLSKAQGLAEFAAEHGDDYGRIEFIDFVGTGKNKKLARINLKDAKIQKRVKSIDTSDALADILAENISE